MSAKTSTAKANAARHHEETAQRNAACGLNGPAAESYLKAGKLYSQAGDLNKAEKAWRRACDFCERTANQISRRPKFDA